MMALPGLTTIEIIRTDGRREHHDVGKNIAIEWSRRMSGADALDSVNLRDGRVMMLDDHGYEVETVDMGIEGDPPRRRFVQRCVRALKPVNQKATELYWSVCKPGTTHQIVGDVAIVVDEDLA